MELKRYGFIITGQDANKKVPWQECGFGASQENIKNDVSISISDMSGKKLWQANNSISGKVRFVNLPVEKYVAGIYIVTVTSGAQSKTIKLIKK